jgi:uncharacterized protein
VRRSGGRLTVKLSAHKIQSIEFAMSFDPQAIRSAVEKDFQNREFAQNISLGMMRVVRFLNTFHSNVRGRLADLNQKLTQLERRLVFIENQLKCCTGQAAE